MRQLFRRNKSILLYAIGLAILLILLRWLELRLLIIRHAFEVYAGRIAVIFTVLGIWLAQKLTRPKTVIVEKPVRGDTFVFNEWAFSEANITKRELEVLTEMANGLSNEEIAAKLFVSLNTVKTHAARLFIKLDVKRRTQAVEKAKRIGILP